MPRPSINQVRRITFPARDYDLRATLTCGQAFRWRVQADCWVGVVGRRWVQLRHAGSGIEAEASPLCDEWDWLRSYLQLDANLDEVVAGFPPDEVLRRSVEACWGLRLLRQDPWECVASFILSANKQIVQIQRIIATMSERLGEELIVPEGALPAWAFPTPGRLAATPETQLRACKMGFRAPNLLRTARMVADGKVDLGSLGQMELEQAREVLLRLPGVGRKIADCVLLFAYGFQQAFPVDVWIMKALHQLYFPRRRPSPARLRRFIEEHFGPWAGYAQQYLFHYMRLHKSAPITPRSPPGLS